MENIENIKFIKVLNPEKLEDIKENNSGSFIHYHNTVDGNVVEDNLYIGECRMTDNFNIGEMSPDLKTIKVEGLAASTLGELSKKSMSQIIIDMVCPLVYPTHTNPELNVSYSGSKLIGVGDVLPTRDDIVTSINQGEWSDGTEYAGDCGDVDLTMNPDKWGTASDEGAYVISGKVSFEGGLVPKDSHGNDWSDEVYAGGDVASNEVTIKSVYPICVNDSSIDVMDERLVDYLAGVTFRVEIPDEVDGTYDKFKIYLPSQFGTFEVRQFNVISGKYDIDVEMELIEGETSKYIRTNDVKSTLGKAKYEIKLKK